MTVHGSATLIREQFEMSSRKLVLGAPAAAGLVILVWALVSAREERPAAAPVRAPRPAPAPPEPRAERRDPSPAPSAARPAKAAETPSPGGIEAAVQSRVSELEDRLRALEARRDALAAENRDLEKQASERYAQAGALSTAQWRVRAWEKLLGLTEGQKKEVLDLATGWAKEDAGGRASREAWGVRENELRARLTSEQAARLAQNVASTAAGQWRVMGQAIGQYAGLPSSEHVRVQQALGDFRLPDTALLQEAHGADWGGIFREAASRARPLLTPEQAARLDRYGGGTNQ